MNQSGFKLFLRKEFEEYEGIYRYIENPLLYSVTSSEILQLFYEIKELCSYGSRIT